jgi:hypothetical protein
MKIGSKDLIWAFGSLGASAAELSPVERRPAGVDLPFVELFGDA